MIIIEFITRFFIIILFIVIELWYSYREKKELYEIKDSLTSFAIGLLWFLSNFLSNLVFFGALHFMYKLRLFDLGNS